MTCLEIVSGVNFKFVSSVRLLGIFMNDTGICRMSGVVLDHGIFLNMVVLLSDMIVNIVCLAYKKLMFMICVRYSFQVVTISVLSYRMMRRWTVTYTSESHTN